MADALENYSDESLMDRLQQRDHRAFSLLVQRRSDMFYMAAYRMVMQRQEAEDVVQEAFLKLWDNPAIWKSDKGAKFTTWFYKIVMNVAIDKLRKNKKTSYLEINDDIVDQALLQDKNMMNNEEQKALGIAMRALPEKQLMALNLCFYEEVSNKEAADIMGVSVKALESLLMRAKHGLKDALLRSGILQQGDAA